MTIKNIDNEPITVEYDKTVVPTLMPGKTITLPAKFGNHLMDHLITQIMNKRFPTLPTTSQSHREQIRSQILMESKDVGTPEQKNKQALFDEQIAALNRAQESEDAEIIDETAFEMDQAPIDTAAASSITRPEMYAYLQNTVRLNLNDPATAQAIEAMSIDELVANYGSPR